MRAIALLAAGASGCDFDAEKAEKWLKTQGCTDGTPNNCPGGQTPAAGCSDTQYISRMLSAGGALPGGPSADEPDSQKYVWYSYKNTTYHLTNADGFMAFIQASGWKMASSQDAKSAPRGALVIIDAWYGEPCYAKGNNVFFCHTPPLDKGKNCDIGAADLEKPGATKGVWVCGSSPPSPPTPPSPPPAPTPAPAPVPPTPPSQGVCLKACTDNQDCWTGTSDCTNCITVSPNPGKCGTMCQDACNSDSECLVAGCGKCDKNALPTPRCVQP